ncbi:hypothetical protein EX30DRAFT_367478 [Ascodesmis nigricans]|uniref:Zn(2)-C6 fungal-type domain-containing protein n=1 Tax=Ascodesmis nigricans TaxID=341454 RepID=A0A4V6RHA2_9PEZI|nr:hypothetical protein EX30DRAFT_367478 [Ascodesmis nigricans]
MSRCQHPDSQSPPDSQGADAPGDEFTRVVKRKLAASRRTGQACDRCKVRKIRCDGLPGGCSPCIQNRHECKTTDRISQKPIPRGHLENLERQVNELTARNQELHAQLAIFMQQQNNGAYNLQDWANNGVAPQRHDPTADRWRSHGRSPYPCHVGTYAAQGVSNRSRPVSVVPGTSSAHYLGISSERSCLGNMKQMALKLLGVDIDLSLLDLPNDDSDGSEANDAVLRAMFNIGPLPKAELPPKKEGISLVEFYFQVSHPYLPILHKPTFMKFVNRIYSDHTYQPTVGQIVCLHMVFAIMYWQNAAHTRLQGGKNAPSSDSMFAESKRHYHYAISHFFELHSSSSFEDVQAFALILQHMRSFPKPGQSWFVARIATTMCVELGLHRSTKNWKHDGPKPSVIEIEMRKRVFYCILSLEVAFTGKLGRPMSIQDTDWDVELPERVEDEDITENGIINSQHPKECSIDVGLDLFRHAVMTIKIHTTLYCSKRPNLDKLYVEKVNELEHELEKSQGESDLCSVKTENPIRQYQAAQVRSWYHESRILMRHPSLNLSPSPQFTEECTKICVESARQILYLTDQRRQGSHNLDTTWYGATVQLMAAVTILYSVWVKGKDATPEEVDQMKKDMELCQSIMADLDKLLGSNNQLEHVVRLLAQGTMKLLFPHKDERQQRMPSMNSESRSPPPLPPLPSGPSGLPPAIVTSPAGNSAATPAEPNSRGATNFQPPNNMPFIDPSVAHSEPPNNTASIYNFQTPQTGSFNADPVQGPGIFWHWGSNSNWTKFSQDLSCVTTDLTPSGVSPDLYECATGLAALQAQNYLQASNGALSGPVANQGLGLGTPHVLTHNPHVSLSPSPSAYSHGMHQSPSQWTSPAPNYSFSDASLRVASPDH